jgi:hypothetical protein
MRNCVVAAGATEPALPWKELQIVRATKRRWLRILAPETVRSVKSLQLRKRNFSGESRMKKLTRFLALCAILLTISFFSAPLFQPLSAQQEDETLRALYNDREQFEMLSSAAQNLLETKFGRKQGNAPLDPPVGFGPPSENASDRQEAQAQAEPESGSRILMALENPTVNDRWLDSTARDTQSETTIAFGSGTNLIVGYNDSGSFTLPNVFANNKFTGFSRSFNMGGIWKDEGTLPTTPFPSMPGAPAGDAGDPVLARWDQTGRLFFSTLAFSGTGIQVFRSDDDAATWNLPVNGTPGIVGPPFPFQDKEWMAVDNFAGLGNGNVYLAWRQFGGAGQGIRFTRSLDAGASFGPSGGGVLIAPAGIGNVQGAWVATGPDHAVYVFWLDQSAGANTPNIIRMRKSTDQGMTFGATINVAMLLTTLTNGSLGNVGGFRTPTFPQVVVNPTNANNVYIVYQDNPAGVDSGNTYFRQSADGGATWSAQVQLNNDATTNLQWFPAIAVTPDGSRLAVSWYDRRRDPADRLIERWGVIGNISGTTVTFGPNFRISDQFPPVFGGDPVVNIVYMGDYDTMIADNQFFYGTWGDNRDPAVFAGATRNTPDIRFAKIPVAGPGPILDLIETTVSGGDGDGVIEPNECIDLNLKIMNDGATTATGITAEVTNFTNLVTVAQATSSYPNLAPEAMATNATAFQLSVSPIFPCAVPIELKLTLNYTGGSDIAYLTLPTCQCPTATVSGSLTSTDPQQMGRVFRDGVPSVCGPTKACDLLNPTTLFRYDAHTFTNGPVPACVKVDVSTACADVNFIFAAAYAGSFVPDNVCTNFLADTGASPFPNASMTFNVAANQTFVVVISEVTANAGCPAYSVTVSNLGCLISGPGVCPPSFTEPQQAHLKPGAIGLKSFLNAAGTRFRSLASALTLGLRSPGPAVARVPESRTVTRRASQ